MSPAGASRAKSERQAAGNRRCVVCQESLAGRDPRARTCSDLCRYTAWRGNRRRAERESQDLYARCNWLRPDVLVRQLDEWLPREEQNVLLNGSLRKVERWRKGETKRVHWADADVVLVALDRAGLWQLDEQVWIDDGETVAWTTSRQ